MVTISQAAAWGALAFFPGAMVFAAVMDFMTMKIRNRLVIAIVLGYVVLAPLVGFGLNDMAWSLAVAAAVFVAGFALFSMGWIGGGDAKLMAATVLWLGPDHILLYLIYTALLGGVLTLAILGFRRIPLPERWRAAEWVARLHSPQSGVPYGAAMAPAALLVFPDTAWVAAIL